MMPKRCVLFLILLQNHFQVGLLQACTPPNCNERGTCSAAGACVCKAPWTGSDCLTRDPCKIVNEEGEFVDRNCHHGTCVVDPKDNSGVASICKCDEGYYLSDCSARNACIKDENHAPVGANICSGAGKGICRPRRRFEDKKVIYFHQCDCEIGFAGRECEFDDPCGRRAIRTPLCSNNGYCVPILDSNGVPQTKCYCYYQNGASGAKCEIMDPCKNHKNADYCIGYAAGFGGTCERISNTEMKCNCYKDFVEGKKCEIVNLCKLADNTLCNPNNRHAHNSFCMPCHNGGVCSRVDQKPGKGEYSCDCSQTGFTGDHCDILKGSVAIIPGNITYIPNGHVATFEALAGVEYLYYIVALSLGESTEIEVDTDDGLKFELSLTAFKPVTEKHPLLANIYNISDTAIYYKFFHTYLDGTFELATFLKNGGIISDIKKTDVTVVLPPEARCIPTTKLRYAASDASEATEYKRTNKIEIEAILKFGCYEDQALEKDLNSRSEEFHYTWILHKLSIKDPGPNEENDWHLEIFRSNSSDKFMVFMPYVLLTGDYMIECKAFITIQGKDYGHSQMGFFRVTPSAPLIKLEDTERSVDGDKEIILDASQSVDVTFPEDSKYLVYNWQCMPPCAEGPWHESIVKIPPKTFKAGTTEKITLTVISKHAHNTALKEISLRISNKASLQIICVRNCKFFNPGEEVVFKCNYTLNGKRGPPDAIKWGWSLKDEIITEGEPPYASVQLPRVQDLEPRSIFCNVTPPGLIPMGAQFTIPINTAPIGGNCVIRPATGTYLKTKFSITCDGFTDPHAPIEYSFYAQARSDGYLLHKLAGTFLLGHDTNPSLDEVYLPYGNKTADYALNVTVKVMDGLGLYTRVILPVKVNTPADTEYPGLFKSLIHGKESLLRKRLAFGDTQGALQLQMVASYGIYNELIAATLTDDDRHMALSVIEHDLLQSPLPTFKTVEQVLDSVHILDHAEDRTDTEILSEINIILSKSADKLEEYATNNADVSTKNEVDTVARATIDSASREIEKSYIQANLMQIMQPAFIDSINIRDMLDYDPLDFEPAELSEEIFLEVDDEVNDDDDIEEKCGDVAQSAELDVKVYAVICHHAMHTVEKALNAAVDHLGYIRKFDTMLDGMAAHAEIIDDLRTEVNLTMTTYIENYLGKQTEILIPNGTLQAVHDKLGKDYADIEVQVIVSDANPYFDDTSAEPDAPIVNVLLKNPKTHARVKMNLLPEPIELKLPFLKTLTDDKIQRAMSEPQRILVVHSNDITDMTEFTIFKIIVPYNSIVDINVIEPSSETLNFTMVAIRGRKPVLYDFLNVTAVSVTDGLHGQFKTERLELNRKIYAREPFLEYYVGLFAFDPKNPNTIQSFSILISRPSCLHRDEDHFYWSEDRCMIKPDSISYYNNDLFAFNVPRPDTVICLCNHLSYYSAVHFIVPIMIENATKSDDVTVTEIQKFPVVLIVVCVILSLYLIGLAICIWFDFRDFRKDICLTLVEDLKYDENETIHYYLITVQTGSSCCAGTTSSIGLILCGSNGDSKPFILRDKTIKVFRQGGFDTFLVCDQDLGTIEKVFIWSDFSGSGPHWYCRKILIRCVSSEKVWYFFVNRWMSKSSLHFEVPASTEKMPKQFYERFKDNLMEHFNNKNLWTSVFRYSLASNFTRCQRLSCAFGMLTSYMFADIMFHGTPTEDEEGMYEFGGIEIDLFDMWKGFLIELIALPWGILLVTLFRHITPRNTPTILMWENVVPADGSLQGKNIYILKILGQEDEKVPKRVHILDLLDEGDSEAETEKTPTTTTFDRESRASTATTATGSTNFSIPSTDITALEDRIKESSVDKTDDDKTDNEVEEYPTDKYVFSLDSNESKNEDQEANNIFRLGRRAMIESFRDVEPESFIFQGEHSIMSIEEMIDKQLAQGVAKKSKPTPKAILKAKVKDTVKSVKSKPKKEKKPPKEKKKKKSKDKKKKPWKKAVTEQYLKEIDKKQQEEIEAKRFMQDKRNWVPRTVLEMCMRPLISRPTFTLPWWVIFIAWGICISSIIACSALTIFFGIHYGYLSSMHWFNSFSFCFLESIFLVEPVVGCLIALITTALGKGVNVKERVQIMTKDKDEEPSKFEEKRKPLPFNVLKPPVKEIGPPTSSKASRLSL